MLIKRWNKTRNCFVWDVRLIDENGKKRLFSTGHTSKKLAEDYVRIPMKSATYYDPKRPPVPGQSGHLLR